MCPDVHLRDSEEGRAGRADETKPTLRVVWGPDAGREFVVQRESTLGRENVDFVLTDDQVSRRHALIRPVAGGVVLEDLGSTNGTYVDGERTTGPVTLERSASIRVGSTELALEPTPGATRVRARPPALDDSTRIAWSRPESAVMMALTEAELMDAEAGRETVVIPVPEVPAPLPAAARRLGIDERNRRTWTLAAMCLALALIMLDITVVNVALPAIQDDLHTSLAGLEWTVNAYTLGFAVFLVTGGRLGDIYGRRRVFVIGIAIFTISSVVIGAAPNETLLVAGRAFQGIGAALMMPGTLSIITNTFPPEERGRALGTWAGVSGVALALGPVVGGALTEHVSWRAVFYVNVPVAIAAIAVTLLAAPESKDPNVERRVDIPGVALLSVSLSAMLLAVIQASSWGWGSVATIALLAGSVIGLIAFVFAEQRIRAPMIEFACFRSARFISANGVGFVLTFAMIAMFVYMALYMQSVLGYTALQTGVRFLPGTVALMLTAPISGRLIERVAPHYLMAAGLAIVAAALFVDTRISADTGYGLVLPSFLLLGTGVGLTLTPMSTAAMNAVIREKAGAASGILSMSRQLGGAFGVAIVGALFGSLSESNVKDNIAALPLNAAQRDAVVHSASGFGASSGGGAPIDPTVAAHINQAVHGAVSDALATALAIPAWLALGGAVGLLLWLWRTHVSLAPSHLDTHAPGPVEL